MSHAVVPVALSLKACRSQDSAGSSRGAIGTNVSSTPRGCETVTSERLVSDVPSAPLPDGF